MLVKSLKELRARWEKEIEQEEGKEYLKKYKKSLDEQWEYLVSGGFVRELPKKKKAGNK